MRSRPARVARGCAAAIVSTLVAAVSHTAGGGAFPSPLLILAGLVFSAVFCIVLVGPRVSWRRLVPSVIASQALFHLLFSTGGSQGAVLLAEGGVAGHVGHGGHGMTMTSLMDYGAAPAGPPMTLAHAVAAVVTIVALRYGEAAFWTLLDTARLMVTSVLRILIPLVVGTGQRRAPGASDAGAVVARSADLVAAVRRRGPPLAVAV